MITVRRRVKRGMGQAMDGNINSVVRLQVGRRSAVSLFAHSVTSS